jgi:hypothetical protein
MKNNIFIYLIIVLFSILMGFILIFIFTPISPWKYPLKIAQGNEIIKKLEKYYAEKQKFPETLDDISINSNLNDIYYYKCNGYYFTLGFSVLLGESITYDSRVKEWK